MSQDTKSNYDDIVDKEVNTALQNVEAAETYLDAINKDKHERKESETAMVQINDLFDKLTKSVMEFRKTQNPNYLEVIIGYSIKIDSLTYMIGSNAERAIGYDFGVEDDMIL